MARIKGWEKIKKSRHRWIEYPYNDHAGQPASFLINEETNLELKNDPEIAPVPEFAFQVYSTIPLDPDHTALCEYLSAGYDSWPQFSFEIYAPQPDVFACVEHQRREIAHRKRNKPGDNFLRGIAKVVPTTWCDSERLPQGFLLVITSHSYRVVFLPKHYEEGTGPLWVTQNRSFPLNTRVDILSRFKDAPLSPDIIPYTADESDLYLEREEIVVTKCQNIYEMGIDLKSAFGHSHLPWGEDFDYVLDEDEGHAPSTEEAPEPEVLEWLEKQANLLSTENFSIISHSDRAVTITTSPAVSEPDLQYIIHVALSYPGLKLAQIAQAFAFGLTQNLPSGKSIHLEFYLPPDPSLASAIVSHRALLSSRPDIAVGAMQTTAIVPTTEPRRMRVFPLTREDGGVYDDWRVPYRTFAVILDRPDFLTAPGILFLLADGGQITEEHERESSYGPGDIYEYQVWRSVGMPEVARRLAMLALEETHEEECRSS